VPLCALNSAEVGVEKPNPVIFEAACERLGCRPVETVHVGDDRRCDTSTPWFSFHHDWECQCQHRAQVHQNCSFPGDGSIHVSDSICIRLGPRVLQALSTLHEGLTTLAHAMQAALRIPLKGSCSHHNLLAYQNPLLPCQPLLSHTQERCVRRARRGLLGMAVGRRRAQLSGG